MVLKALTILLTENCNTWERTWSFIALHKKKQDKRPFIHTAFVNSYKQERSFLIQSWEGNAQAQDITEPSQALASSKNNNLIQARRKARTWYRRSRKMSSQK